MINKKKSFALLFFFISLNLSFNSYSQIQKLKDSLLTLKTDTQKANLCLVLSDSLTTKNHFQSIDYALKAMIYFKRSNHEQGLARSYFTLGLLYSQTSADSSILYYQKSLQLYLKLKKYKNIASLYNQIATLYEKDQNVDLALTYYLKSIKMYELVRDENGVASSSLGIGNVFLNSENYPRAIQYYQQSLEAYKKTKSPSVTRPMVNLAIIYVHLKEDDKAKKLFNQALALSIKNKDYYVAAYIFDELGDFNFGKKKYNEALIYFYKALAIKRENKYPIELFTYSYSNLAEVFIKLNASEKARLYLDSLKKVVYELNANNFILDYLELKSQYYEKINDFKNAFIFKSEYMNLHDSLVNFDMYSKISEADAKQKTENKQKEIELLNKEKTIQQFKIDEHSKQRNMFIIGFFILIIMLVLIYRSYLQKQKHNVLITEQKKQVEHKNLIIEIKQKEIVDSINYAKRIQYAQLANHEMLCKNLSEYFVLFGPKDIVSGDFYWATEHNQKFYLAVCDCTGHGVSGAFMSLLSIGFLNEGIKDKGIAEPHHIFNYVRDRFIDSKSENNHHDGFDGVLICYDKIANTITYAAANNGPLLIRNNELTELPKDKMPVAKVDKMESFKSYSINILPGDKLYLYSDGFADQFGGEHQKKFKHKTFLNLLHHNSSLAMNEQRQQLYKEFNVWKGDLEQVDDICVLGIKI